MNFLRDKDLKQLGAYLVGLTLFVFVVQYLIIDFKIAQAEEAELKIEYTQLAQLNNQKISAQVQQFMNGSHSVVASIAAMIDEQDFHLKTLSAGGRFAQRNDFVQPLSRLPRITYDGLKENWDAYKNSIFVLIAAGNVHKPDSAKVDSAEAISVLVSSNPALAKMQYEGLSITMADWYDKLVQDLNEEVQLRKSGLTRWKVGVLIFNILGVGAAYFLFVLLIVRPITVIEDNIKNHRRTEGFPKNELGQLAGTINDTVENLKDATDFVIAIGKGDLALDYREALDHHYEPGKNKLADSLIEMQKKLQNLSEEEQKRQWANEGLTKFVEILRSSNDDLSILGDKIISSLIHYTRSTQGALYIVNEDDPANKFLEMVSLYAWDIKKYEQQRIKAGQGLLGQTLLEKETTYLTVLPEEYIRITSGLGGANPKSILIVPLKVGDDVYGLVELASFNDYQSHEISFVEKLGETIASTLASVRAAQKNKLLIGQFQQQTEQMRAQEEEMRQNMEELQATQEEVVRKERSYIARISELEAQLKTMADPAELARLKEFNLQRETEFAAKIDSMQKKLDVSLAQAKEWEIAAELNKTLQMQIEALRITQEELTMKNGA